MKVSMSLHYCSAGVGRTGTFIAIDSQLDKAKIEGEVDVLKYVLEMRMDRIKMVQTKVSRVCFDAIIVIAKLSHCNKGGVSMFDTQIHIVNPISFSIHESCQS